MRHPLFIALIMVALLAGCAKKQAVPVSRLPYPAGNFSLIPPAGWHRTKLPGVDYVIVATHADAGIKPNIYIDGVFTTSTRAETVSLITQKNTHHLRAYQLREQTNFTTQSGLCGIKISATHETKAKLTLATFQYLVQDQTRMIAITCTCANSVKSTYEPLFDTAIHSLESEQFNP